ncbi:hypothetical protein Taro_045795 [Colocasia esculenta]|uniref:Uncharacterized protein n=1 Tax=Colocasia esculenta TaxID=4460 RepID=A0A843WXW1_COLES|nr:hypothetical protein [Colocasia esculenta]
MFRSDRWLQSTFAGTLDGKEVEGIINSSNFWDRVFKLVQIIEPLYEILRVVDKDRRPSIGLVYVKLEATKKKIRDVSPQYAHLVLDVVEDRWDRQMSRDLHKAAYCLHPAYHYTHELAYEDDLTASFTRVVQRLSRSPLQTADAIDETSIGLSTSKQIVEFDMHDQFNMKNFREAIRGFAEPSAITSRKHVEGGKERGEYELDEEADDPEDPPRLNTFLAKAVAEATAEEEGDRGDVGQPYSPQFQADLEAEVDLLGDRTGACRGHGHDDDFKRLMEGLPRTQSFREAPSQSRRTESSAYVVAPSQSRRPPSLSQLVKGKQIAQESRPKKIGATESRPLKELLYESHLPQYRKRRVGDSSSNGGGGGGGDTPLRGGGGDNDQGGGGGGIAFTKE